MSRNVALEKVYDPRAVEPEMYALWEARGAFAAEPDERGPEQRFVIVIPPPNVTGALHLGHAINNTLQDILIRWHRMRGENTLWLPGVDHAGIATQAVVEKRLREEEGLTRHQLGRERLVERIWAWKDQYQKRIIQQLKLIGCSCDWQRTRFTLDDGLARAVRTTFYRLFKDGLIYRGKRLVNWDSQLQTAVADDEVYRETIKGHFWHIKYPVIDPQAGEPTHVHVATTRPETMLGDTAVAVHPDPEGFLNKREAELGEKRATASGKEIREIDLQLKALAERRETHLPLLRQLRDMAAAGRQVRLPLMERAIPVILDEWADPTKGSGCVKITPAHDPNDYEVGRRHGLAMVNALTPDGKVSPIVEPDGSANPHSDKYAGLEFTGAGRQKVVADLEAAGLLEKVEDHEMEVGHSDRSKKMIEPYLSDQWFLGMGDRPGGVTLGDGTRASGLAQAAMDAVLDGRVKVFPDRYAKTYLDWLGEKREWCISRQLWWGHRIPVWSREMQLSELLKPKDSNMGCLIDIWHGTVIRVEEVDGPGAWQFVEDNGDCSETGWSALRTALNSGDRRVRVVICPHVEVRPSLRQRQACADDANARGLEKIDRNGTATRGGFTADDFGYDARLADRVERYAEDAGFVQDPDVLDTWFSSQLWPFSTMGWPEDTADAGYYYPGSVLITSRDIITLWVARMVLSGLYCTGKVPFEHVYIHAKILDGRGEGMSKSKGNGVDPLDIVEVYGGDALRYALAEMTTETQDVRMPVEYRCPHCEGLTAQTAANMHAKTLKCQPCGKTFATQWADAPTMAEHGRALMVSDRFEVGRNFCNKLWNAARFAYLNLEGTECRTLKLAELPPEDRWILARLHRVIVEAQQALKEYRYSASIRCLREFFWDALCDWYIELTKPRLTGGQQGAEAKQVLAFCLDQILRLLHPFLPFITERLWGQLDVLAPRRGLPGLAELGARIDSPTSKEVGHPAKEAGHPGKPAGHTERLLIRAAFPPAEGWPALDDPAILDVFADIQAVTRGVREMRNAYKVSPKQAVQVTVKAPADHAASLERHAHIIQELANAGDLQVVAEVKRPPNAAAAVIGGLHIYVHDISDDTAERARVAKELAELAKLIPGKQNKLANENFVKNADPQVVQGERERLAELLSRKQALEAGLAELG
jgi:valyl-tRNA synthetase